MPGLALDTGKTHEASSPAAPLLLLILNKQFTKRWHDVARSGDKGSPLPAAWTVEEQEACFVLRNYALIRASSDVRFWGKQTSRGRASMCTSDRSEHFTDHMWRLSQS